MSDLSWLNPTPHAIAVYASQPLSPVATQHSLSSGRYSLLGPDLHRLDRTSLRLAHLFDHLVGKQQERFRDGEPERLAGGFKPDIGNPVALAPAQAGLFILALEGCRRVSEQRRFYILKCVDAD